MEEKIIYETPQMEVIELKVEKGFANSIEGIEKGDTW